MRGLRISSARCGVELAHEPFELAADPRFVAVLAGGGYTGLTPEQQCSLGLHNVGTGFLEEIRLTKLERPSLSQLVEIGIQGISLDEFKQWRSDGYPLSSVINLLELHKHDVAPEFSASLSAVGCSNLTVSELLQLRDHGVDVGYIRELAALGYGGLLVDQLVVLRDGIGPEFIRQANSRLGRASSVDDLLGLHDASR